MQTNAQHKKRQRAEARFLWCGRLTLGFVLALVVALLGLLIWRGADGLIQVQLRLPIQLEGHHSADAPVSEYLPLARRALLAQANNPQLSVAEKHGLFRLLSGSGSALMVRKAVMRAQEKNGTSPPIQQEIWLPASALLSHAWRHDLQGLDASQTAFVQKMASQGRIRKIFDTGFFSHGDSRTPENAGMLGALIGSLFTLVVCMSIALTLGVASAVYLEEFAPKHWVTHMLEVSINNLAAVPSIIFGLLGLVVYITLLGMPRSSPLAAGLTLALLILPVVIIATRAALNAVPDSIAQAALALGASPLQAVWHHTLPLALPGIMTGAILGISRAIGETAPLLMIGMVAFVADIPHGPMSAATAMPVQVYLWASSPESGFAERTAAGICMLLLVLLALNVTAIYIRKRFETRW